MFQHWLNSGIHEKKHSVVEKGQQTTKDTSIKNLRNNCAQVAIHVTLLSFLQSLKNPFRMFKGIKKH